MAKKKTSVMIDEALCDEVKLRCIKEKKEIGEYLEEVLRKELKR